MNTDKEIKECPECEDHIILEKMKNEGYKYWCPECGAYWREKDLQQ
jgi:predicted RNA-binding Zn-ribbon protein involved in translation (DUF1610 family)